MGFGPFSGWVSAATLCGACFFEAPVFSRVRTFKQTRALDTCGQATKGVWGMSWHQEAMKGVEVCEKLGGVDKQMMIPRFLN